MLNVLQLAARETCSSYFLQILKYLHKESKISIIIPPNIRFIMFENGIAVFPAKLTKRRITQNIHMNYRKSMFRLLLVVVGS